MQVENAPYADSLKEENLYSHALSYQDMEDCLAEAAEEELDDLIKKSDYIGVMVDESTDISVFKKLLIYSKVCVNGQPAIVFGANVAIQDGKAATVYKAIVDFLEMKKIPMDKVIGFASDGASVMVGRKTGVTTLLKQANPFLISIHCIAHRLALAAAGAASCCPYLVQYKTIESNFQLLPV